MKFNADVNKGSTPNYYPGSATHPNVSQHVKEGPMTVEGVVGRYDQAPADPDGDFIQPRA